VIYSRDKSSVTVDLKKGSSKCGKMF